MKNILSAQILSGSFKLEDILEKIDIFFATGRLTSSDREELYALAREKANPVQESDLAAKVLELENRLRTLEEKVANLPAGGETPTEKPVEPFVDGKWYHNGERAEYKGEIYEVCNVPDGQVCVWSPEAYPAYWKLVGVKADEGESE